MEITKVRRIKREFNKRHNHANGQLIILESGLINVRADHGSWLVPEKRLAWIPKEMFHSSQALTEINGWTILTNEEFEKKLPNDICIIQASDLLFSLLKRIITTQNDSNTIFYQKAVDLFLMELDYVGVEKLGIPLPYSPEILKVTEAFLGNISSNKNLEEWAAYANISKRSFTRQFLKETGLSFGQWKKEAMNFKAMELLSSGSQVTDIAYELGYENVSAFISMFKRKNGKSPTKINQQFIQ